jgi:carboxylate-amine ligase
MTVGVEEEFLLVDPVSRNVVARASATLHRARQGAPPATGAVLQPELAGTQVEAATGVCTRLDDLRDPLGRGRRRLAEAAAAEGARLVSTGTPVLPSIRPVVSAVGDSSRYQRIADTYAGVIPDYQACGCHVHVGVPDRETAIAVVNHLRPWLPSLLALSVNSPFDYGRDSGYGSWRIVSLSRFPTAGVPPWYDSAAAYDQQLARLVECGMLVDTSMTFWLARPSARLPTVEVRAADAATTVGEAVLHAGLARALVRSALAELERGREAVPVADPLLAAALWSASRYGLQGPGVHPFEERRVSATTLLRELLVRVAPELEETGDLGMVRRLLADVLRDGTGATRQRRAAVAGPEAVVDMLAEQTLLGGEGAPRPATGPAAASA